MRFLLAVCVVLSQGTPGKLNFFSENPNVLISRIKHNSARTNSQHVSLYSLLRRIRAMLGYPNEANNANEQSDAEAALPLARTL